jgi:hypothetical protein
MKYEYQTNESMAGYTVRFWVHLEEDNSDSLLNPRRVVPKLVPVEAT